MFWAISLFPLLVSEAYCSSGTDATHLYGNCAPIYDTQNICSQSLLHITEILKNSQDKITVHRKESSKNVNWNIDLCLPAG